MPARTKFSVWTTGRHRAFGLIRRARKKFSGLSAAQSLVTSKCVGPCFHRVGRGRLAAVGLARGLMGCGAVLQIRTAPTRLKLDVMVVGPYAPCRSLGARPSEVHNAQRRGTQLKVARSWPPGQPCPFKTYQDPARCHRVPLLAAPKGWDVPSVQFPSYCVVAHESLVPDFLNDGGQGPGAQVGGNHVRQRTWRSAS
jgi:hypothetical protein